MTRLKYHLST